MKNLVFLILITLSCPVYSQYNYVPFDKSEIKFDLSDQEYQSSIDYPIYRSYLTANEQLISGLAIGGMAGLAFYFDTIGEGQYIPMGYTFSAISLVKVGQSFHMKRKEKKWKERNGLRH
jgi:hypothetical protein